MSGKVTKIADLRGKTDDELRAGVLQLRREQFNLRFQAASNQLSSSARMRAVRREIAKIKTVQAQRFQLSGTTVVAQPIAPTAKPQTEKAPKVIKAVPANEPKHLFEEALHHIEEVVAETNAN